MRPPTFPDVLSRINVASAADVARALRNHQAEIGITVNPIGYGSLETVAELASEFFCIGTHESLNHLVGSAPSGALQSMPSIYSTGIFRQQLDGWLAKNDVQVAVTVEASQSQFSANWSCKGAGISIVDCFTAMRHAQHGGRALPLPPPLPHRFYITAASDTRISAPASELIRLMKDLAVSNLKCNT